VDLSKVKETFSEDSLNKLLEEDWWTLLVFYVLCAQTGFIIFGMIFGCIKDKKDKRK